MKCISQTNAFVYTRVNACVLACGHICFACMLEGVRLSVGACRCACIQPCMYVSASVASFKHTAHKEIQVPLIVSVKLVGNSQPVLLPTHNGSGN